MSLHNFLLSHLRSHIKNSCFVFHHGFQTPRNNNFISSSGFGTPDETLALVFDILRNTRWHYDGLKTDHSLITIRAALHSNQRGPGYWKLNTSFLLDVNYVNQIRTTIQKVTDEYVNDDNVNPTLMWEMIKLKIREQSIKYAKDRRTKTSRREEEIEKAINVLEEFKESSNKGDREKKEASRDLEEKKAELEIQYYGGYLFAYVLLQFNDKFSLPTIQTQA